jgi:phosphatidylserine/phosphatidylglycerophosphate/cardiolipin synthase-like enzyme
MANPPHAVSNERIPEHAERLLAGPVALGELALAFSESTASSAEVLVRVRLFVPANANNWACAGAQQFHNAKLLDAGVRILEYPTMLHAKAFLRDGEELLAGNCNLEAWSLSGSSRSTS